MSRYFSFAFLNENFCVLYVTEYQAHKLFTAADLAAFTIKKILDDFLNKLLRDIYAADGAQHLGWLEFLHNPHEENTDFSEDSLYMGESNSPCPADELKNFEMLQLERIAIAADITQLKKSSRSFEDAAARKKELYAELAAVEEKVHDYFYLAEH